MQIGGVARMGGKRMNVPVHGLSDALEQFSVALLRTPSSPFSSHLAAAAIHVVAEALRCNASFTQSHRPWTPSFSSFNPSFSVSHPNHFSSSKSSSTAPLSPTSFSIRVLTALSPCRFPSRVVTSSSSSCVPPPPVHAQMAPRTAAPFPSFSQTFPSCSVTMTDIAPPSTLKKVDTHSTVFSSHAPSVLPSPSSPRPATSQQHNPPTIPANNFSFSVASPLSVSFSCGARNIEKRTSTRSARSPSPPSLSFTNTSASNSTNSSLSSSFAGLDGAFLHPPASSSHSVRHVRARPTIADLPMTHAKQNSESSHNNSDSIQTHMHLTTLPSRNNVAATEEKKEEHVQQAKVYDMYVVNGLERVVWQRDPHPEDLHALMNINDSPWTRKMHGALTILKKYRETCDLSISVKQLQDSYNEKWNMTQQQREKWKIQWDGRQIVNAGKIVGFI